MSIDHRFGVGNNRSCIKTELACWTINESSKIYLQTLTFKTFAMGIDMMLLLVSLQLQCEITFLNVLHNVKKSSQD